MIPFKSKRWGYYYLTTAVANTIGLAVSTGFNWICFVGLLASAIGILWELTDDEDTI